MKPEIHHLHDDPADCTSYGCTYRQVGKVGKAQSMVCVQLCGPKLAAQAFREDVLCRIRARWVDTIPDKCKL